MDCNNLYSYLRSGFKNTNNLKNDAVVREFTNAVQKENMPEWARSRMPKKASDATKMNILMGETTIRCLKGKKLDLTDFLLTREVFRALDQRHIKDPDTAGKMLDLQEELFKMLAKNDPTKWKREGWAKGSVKSGEKSKIKISDKKKYKEELERDKEKEEFDKELADFLKGRDVRSISDLRKLDIDKLRE